MDVLMGFLGGCFFGALAIVVVAAVVGNTKAKRQQPNKFEGSWPVDEHGAFKFKNLDKP